MQTQQCDNARTEFYYTKVKSPVAGVAGTIPYRAGALADRNIADPSVCVSDTKEMFAYFSVPESDEPTRSARLGTQEIAFRSADRATPVVTGIMDAVSNTVDFRTGTIDVRARIPHRYAISYAAARARFSFRREKRTA